MDLSLKRIIAFCIDLLIVTCFLSFITRVLPLDPYKIKYQETYDKYMEVANDSKEMTEDYKNEMIDLNYQLYKYRTVSSSISICCLILYFGVLQMVWDGKTIGKKFMNLQLVSNNDKKLGFINYLFRTIILTNIILTFLSVIAVFITKGKVFYYITYGLSLIDSCIYLINIVMITVRKDNRGLHDIVGNTKVVSLKDNIETEDDVKKESIKEKVNKVEKKKKVSKKK